MTLVSAERSAAVLAAGGRQAARRARGQDQPQLPRVDQRDPAVRASTSPARTPWTARRCGAGSRTAASRRTSRSISSTRCGLGDRRSRSICSGYPPDYPERRRLLLGGTPGGIATPTEITSLRGFVAAILDTMEYWADDAQSSLPGYRDRIVEVHLRPDEGGMNLEMDADVVAIGGREGTAGRRSARPLRLRPAPVDPVPELDGPDAGRGEADGRPVRTVESRRPRRRRDLIDRADRVRRSTGVRPTGRSHARDRTEALLRFAIVPEPDFSKDASRARPDPSHHPPLLTSATPGRLTTSDAVQRTGRLTASKVSRGCRAGRQ